MPSNKPITILFDAGPIAAGAKSGVGNYTSRMIDSLALGFPEDVVLIGYYFNFLSRNSKPKLPDHKNITYVPITILPGKLLSAFRIFGVQPPIELFVRKKTDVQLFTNFVSLPSLRKIPKATIIYDAVFFDHPDYVQKKNLHFLQKFVPSSVKRSDLIITISEFTKQRIEHFFPDSRAEIVVTPIPPVTGGNLKLNSEQIPKRLATLGVQANSYILYVGTIEPRKNIENLVKAYALLPNEVQAKYSLVLAGGKGWKDEKILQLVAAEQKLGRKIIMPGYISDGEKQALYANASLFSLASHYEGFGMPILEAMQHKIPTAISNIPVFKEVAGEAAFYFDKDSPKNIAEVLEKSLTDTASRKTVLNLAEKQLQQYNWSSNAKMVFEAIQKILNDR